MPQRLQTCGQTCSGWPHYCRPASRTSITNDHGLTNSDVIVMGEKRTDQPDYYMDGDAPTNPGGDFDRVVEPYRHGVRLGSNYLYLDMHVETLRKKEGVKLAGIDPWDPIAGIRPQ